MVRILLLWILPALCFAQVKLNSSYLEQYTIPTKERHGHRYMIEIDNFVINGENVFKYAAIGINPYNAHHLSYFEFKGAATDEILKDQATVHPFTGAIMNNPDDFKLIHTDFKDIVRVNLEEYNKDQKNSCPDPIADGNSNTPAKERNYAMIFIDKDTPDNKRVRRIGTWYREHEFFKYINDDNEMIEVDDMNAIMKTKGEETHNGHLASRFELLCRVPHDYQIGK